jgi:transglutaminase-like putative cysteine protease
MVRTVATLAAPRVPNQVYQLRPLGPHPRPPNASPADVRKLHTFQAGARHDALDPQVQKLAVRLVRPHRPDDYLAAAREIFRWVRDAIKYTPDADHVQDYSDAMTVIDRGFGNCVTKTRVAVAMLRALGMEAEFSEVWKPSAVGPWLSHVQIRIRFPGSRNVQGNVGGWIYGDLTIKGAELGQDPFTIASREDTGQLPLSGGN